MTVNEVAKALGMTKLSVLKAISRGVMRAGLVPNGPHGAYYVIDEREVERYRAEHRKPRKPSNVPPEPPFRGHAPGDTSTIEADE